MVERPPAPESTERPSAGVVPNPEGAAPLVTISAAWGTGGSWIAPRVADEPTARWRLASGDVARDVDVQHLHRADPQDPWLYHLTIDSMRLPLTACVQAISAAARATVALTCATP